MHKTQTSIQQQRNHIMVLAFIDHWCFLATFFFLMTLMHSASFNEDSIPKVHKHFKKIEENGILHTMPTLS
jgi:hypothetical protein